MKRPHDTTDLLLSPVAIAINERLEALSALDSPEIQRRVTWETNSQPRTPEQAAESLVRSLTYLLDTHGWDVTWDPRGIRLHHNEHDLVLGVPANLVNYVETAGGADRQIPAQQS